MEWISNEDKDMASMKLEELKLTKEELLNTIRENYKQIGKELEENPEVQKYIEYEKEKNKLFSTLNYIEREYNKLYIKLCNHDILYYLDEEKDYHNSRSCINCGCLDCGTRITKRINEVNKLNIIKAPSISFYDVRKIYYNLKERYENNKIFMELKKIVESKEKEMPDTKIYKKQSISR